MRSSKTAASSLTQAIGGHTCTPSPSRASPADRPRPSPPPIGGEGELVQTAQIFDWSTSCATPSTRQTMTDPRLRHELADALLVLGESDVRYLLGVLGAIQHAATNQLRRGGSTMG